MAKQPPMEHLWFQATNGPKARCWIGERLSALQACQLCGTHAFLLSQDLEALTHPFRMDQRLELQAGFRAIRLGLSCIVEVGKSVSLPER